MEEFLEFYEQQTDVMIQEKAIENFAAQFLAHHAADYVKSLAPLQFPLQFPSLQEEINLLALKELLMVGGMFEHMAPLAAQDSLTEVVLFGLIGAFLTECSLNATFMRGLSASDVASLFSLPTTQPEKLPQEQQDSGLAAVVTMEKRGGLAEYADLLASVSYHAGAALKERGHADLSSLLEQESLEAPSTSLETASRSIATQLPGLDDRHFVLVRRGATEQMAELPFLKNARRMVSAVFLKNSSQLHNASTDDGCAKLQGMVPAPSVRTVNTLLSLGILVRRSHVSHVEVEHKDGEVEGEGSSCSSKSSEAEGEVAVRCAAVVACWQLCKAVQRIQSEGCEEARVTPIQLSIYLDSLPVGVPLPERGAVEIFVPRETGQKW